MRDIRCGIERIAVASSKLVGDRDEVDSYEGARGILPPSSAERYWKRASGQ